MKKTEYKHSNNSINFKEVLELADQAGFPKPELACNKEKLLLNFCIYYMDKWNGPVSILEALHEFKENRL